MRRSSKKLFGLLTVVVLLVTACAASDEGADSISESVRGRGDASLMSEQEATANTMAAGSEQPERQPERQPEPAEASDATGAEDSTEPSDLGNGATTPVAFQATNFGRDIIFTADVNVAVTDVAAASGEAIRVVSRNGGFLFGQQSVGGTQPVSVLTFKVDPERFHQTLHDLGSIGEVRTQNVSATDVTDRIVDLESRIATASASVERLRTLLSEATDIKEIVALESELVARETQLETLRGQHRTLQDQVALATIVLTLSEAASNPDLALAVSGYPGHDDGSGCPGGVDGVGVDTDGPATICVEIANAGDTLLADIELRDPVLDLEIEEMTVLFGDLSRPLEPGASMLLAAEIIVERDLRTQTTVSATPVNEDGSEISGPPASRTTTFFVDAVDPGGIPTFTEGLEASWKWLISLAQILLLVAGALLPFIWLPVAGYFTWRLVRRARRQGLAPDRS